MKPQNPDNLTPEEAAQKVKDHIDSLRVYPKEMENPVVVSVENYPGGMAPDFAVIKLRNGACVTVGDDGVNTHASEADMEHGIVSDGCGFAPHKTTDQPAADTDSVADIREAVGDPNGKLREWEVMLKGWGGTPEIVNEFIAGQQARIHATQDMDRQLSAVTAERDRLREALEKLFTSTAELRFSLVSINRFKGAEYFGWWKRHTELMRETEQLMQARKEGV